MALTTAQKIDIITRYEKLYGYPVGSILNVIVFESAGTLSTTIKNKYTGAVGLFQFMPKFYPVATIEKMDFETQLKYGFDNVLAPYHQKLKTTRDELDFYLAVLYPALMGDPETAVFADKVKSPTRYLQNSGLDTNKDGVITKADIRRYFYRNVDAYMNRNGLPGVTITATLDTFFILVLACGYLLKQF